MMWKLQLYPLSVHLTPHHNGICFPTPENTLGRLALQSLDCLDIKAELGKMYKQSSNLKDLSKQLGQRHFHLESKLKTFADNTEEHFMNLHIDATETKD